MNLSDPRTVKKLLERHGFSFTKALGQNFLVDPSVCPRMAALCGADGESGVLEIGAGAGVLTSELSRIARKVVAMELDSRLIPVLDEALGEFSNVTVLQADVMKTDLKELLREHFAEMPVFVCANLPYYITSPVIMLLLESRLPFEAITVMVQKEAAERFCTPVGSRNCGAVTVAANYYAETNILFEVNKDSFLPPPDVDSAVVRFRIRKQPEFDVDEEVFFQTVKAAFAQRRKTLLNSLSAGMGIEKAATRNILETANLPENTRAEQLSMEQFAILSRAVGNFRGMVTEKGIN